MIDLVVWFFIGLFCGALPWSVWITRRFVGRDAREIGDGNPGSANAWKLGGWIVGVLALILYVLKGVVPVLLFLNLTGLGNSTNFLYQLAIGMVIVSPIIGHGWTPFLKFNGGKALATTMGIWTAVSLALALPLLCFFLIPLHVIQKNHSITVTISFVGMALFFFLVPHLVTIPTISLLVMTIMNFAIIVFKHRKEYLEGFLLRNWCKGD